MITKQLEQQSDLDNSFSDIEKEYERIKGLTGKDIPSEDSLSVHDNN